MATLAQPTRPAVHAHVRAPLLVVAAAAIAAALIQSFVMALDCDVSWLITVNEKLLNGARLYVDVIETNPPASVWLYTPVVWLARLLGVRPEAVVGALFVLAGAAAVCAAVRLCTKMREPMQPMRLAAALSFVALIFPLGTFAQREHAALLLALVALPAFAVLAEGHALAPATRIAAAGLAAGLVVVIKPHFILAIAPAAAFAWWKSGNARPLLAPMVSAAGVICLYALAVLAITPQYLALLPMLSTLYVGDRLDWLTLLRGPVVAAPLAVYALCLALRPKQVPALAAMFLIGSAGFSLAAVIEGKGYLNHALPGIALALLGLFVLLEQSSKDEPRRKVICIGAAALAVLELYAMASIRPLPGLAEAVEHVAPPRPAVIALSPDLRIGHPLVRNVDGRWVGSRPALFAAAEAHRQLAEGAAQRQQLLGWYNADMDSFARDVRRGHPNVVLVDARPELAWLRRDPRISGALAMYRPAARAGEVEVWTRR